MHWFAVPAVVLMMCGYAMAADDPAIVVCEKIIKTKILSPKGYERARSKVNFHSATIEFDQQNLYGAWIRSVYVCEFEFSEIEKKFILKDNSKDLFEKAERAYKKKVLEIDERRQATIERKVNSSPSMRKEYEKDLWRIRDEYDDAEIEFAKEKLDIVIERANILSIPFGDGVYPIDPDDTELQK